MVKIQKQLHRGSIPAKRQSYNDDGDSYSHQCLRRNPHGHIFHLARQIQPYTSAAGSNRSDPSSRASPFRYTHWSRAQLHFSIGVSADDNFLHPQVVHHRVVSSVVGTSTLRPFQGCSTYHLCYL